MEEQVISLELARLAKQAGFNWPVLFAYDGSDMRCCDGGFKRINYNTPGGTYCSAPTLSHLQQWLREERQIYIFVYPHLGPKCGYDTFPVVGYSVEGRYKNWAWHYGEFGYPFNNNPLETFEDSDEFDCNEIYSTYETGLAAHITFFLTCLADGRIEDGKWKIV